MRNYLKFLISPILLCLLFPFRSFSQTSVNYTATTYTNASLATDKRGNAISFAGSPNLIVNNESFVNASLLPIGFDVVFMGKHYSHFIAGNDGQVGLGLEGSPAGMMAGVFNNDLTRSVVYPPTFANNAPVLAAFWDDLRTARTGTTVQRTISGTAPNRCFIVQWNAVVNTTSTTNTNPADAVFQLRIYERSGEIEYVYGKMSIGPGSSNVDASIGFTAGNTDNSFIALRDLSSFAFTRLAAEEFASQSLVNTSVAGNINGLHSTSDGARRAFSFLPVASNGSFTNGFVSRVYARTMQLNWADNISNKYGYLLYRSAVDSNNYQLFTVLPSSATSYIATELNTNTRYYWKLIPYTEGNTATVRVFTDSTRCSMNGNYSVGPGGQFSSIRAAQDSLALWGISGVTNWELLPAYNFASETLPVTIKALPPCFENNHTITIRPATGASFNYVHTGNSPVFLLDSTKHIILDGRAGGTGAAAMTLEGSGELVTIRNGWNNIIQYVSFRSNTTHAGTAPVNIRGTAGGGSHHNVISNCNFTDRGSTMPFQMVSGLLSNNAVNDANIVTQCNFSNFRRFAIDIEGKGWQVTGNSFYATAPVTGTDTSGFINTRTVDNTQSFQISGNYFGGSAPQCGGNMMTWSTPYTFRGIQLRSTGKISNNQFKKIKVASTATFGDFSAFVTMAMAGVEGTNFTTVADTIQGNQIGGASPGDSIAISSMANSDFKTLIIYNISTGTAIIENNTIVNVRSQVSPTLNFNLHLLAHEGNNAVIRNNTIGTPDHAYRNMHNTTGMMTGVHTYGRASITGNTITNNFSVRKNAGVSTQANNGGDVTNNLISHIKTSVATQDFDFFAAAGIAAYASTSLSIYNNRILHLEDSSLVPTSGTTGIFCRDVNGTISRNLIDGLIQSNQSINGKSHVGIEIEDGNTTIINNMIRIGLDSAGNTVPKGLFIGYSTNHTSAVTFAHNTIYVRGTNANPDGNSGAYCAFWLAPTTFMNNIMVNERAYTNGLQSGIYLTSSQAQSNWIDYNVYYHSPTGVKFSPDIPTFQAWQASGRDPHSVFKHPNFVNPDAPTRLLNLHVQGSTPAERRGTTNNTTIEDFDGEIRSNLTPVDVGADAGNYIPLDMDPPVVSGFALPDAMDTTSRYIRVYISDAPAGLRSSGNERPTIWYRKSYPTVTPWYYSHGVLDSGTVHFGVWKFYIAHQQLNVSPTGADSIQYYFVAQDTVGNLTINPAAGGVHTSVTQQVTAPTNPYKYRINVGGYIVPSIVHVGVNQRYTSLTKDGGVFEGLRRDSVANGSTITLRIVSHLLENGNWGLDSTITNRNIRVRIEPAYDSTFIIRNETDLATDLIRLRDFDRLVIDGSYNGSGRWLRFINAHTNPANTKATIAILDGSDSTIIRNTELMSNYTGFPLGVNVGGTVVIAGDSCHKPSFINNVFTNIPNSAVKPSIGIMSPYITRVSDVTIRSNHFVNMDIAGMYLGWLVDSVRVDSNHFYWNDGVHHSINYYAIRLFGEAMHVVRNNFIGGSQPFCGGNKWVNDGDYQEFYGIQIPQSAGNFSIIEKNMIRNIRTTNVNANNFFPLSVGGNSYIQFNTVGDSTNNESLEIAGTGNTMIRASGKKNFIIGNLVAGIHTTNAGPFSTTQGIWTTADSAQVVRTNIVRNIRTASSAGGSSSNTMAGIYILTNTINNLVEENEIFNLTATDPSVIQITGIQSASAQNGGGIIRRNRIYNNTLTNSTGGVLAGIYLFQNCNWMVENNQVSLSNAPYLNPVTLYGIYDNATMNTGNNKSIAYNTILLGGAQTAGTTSSFGFLNEGIGVTTRFKNNFIMNTRSGGTGQHGAVAVKRANPATVWPAGVADYNLYVNRDTAAAFLWGTNSILSMSAWRTAATNDSNGYITPHHILPPSDMFVDSVHGNLDINTNNSISWYVNGKGIPLADINADHGQVGIRSTSISLGPTDIGSDEFNTTSQPPPLYVFGRHDPGGSDTLSFNGHIVGIINWANQGTLPTLGTARYYTGTWPNDPTNGSTIANARSWSAYLDLPASGGSGYSYNLTMFYDSSMLGRVTNATTMIVNKRQSNVTGSWTEVHPTISGAPNKRVTIVNQSSFSEFTVTDSLASFVTGAPSAELTVTYNTATPLSIPTGTNFSAAIAETNSGAMLAPPHQAHFYLSADIELTPGLNGDILLGFSEFTNALAAGAISDTMQRTLQMPCNIVPGNYYIIFMADGTNVVAEPNETNNTARLAITVTAGIVAPSAPVVTVTPATTICAPGNITLSASASGCSTCTYSWSNGGTGSSIQVTSSGNYIVTATNTCGNNTASQAVTVNPATQTPFITQFGSSLVSSAPSGNQWYLNGVIIAGATGSTHIPATSGMYTVTANTNGCVSAASTNFNFIITGVVSPELDKQLRMGPNPVDGKIAIHYSGTGAQFEVVVIDLGGRQVLGRSTFTRDHEVDMSRLSAGAYIIKVYNLRNKEQVQRLVVKK